MEQATYDFKNVIKGETIDYHVETWQLDLEPVGRLLENEEPAGVLRCLFWWKKRQGTLELPRDLCQRRQSFSNGRPI